MHWKSRVLWGAAFLFLLAGGFGCAPRLDSSVLQGRAEVAQRLHAGQALEQSIAGERPSLSAVEFRIARFEQSETGTKVRFTLLAADGRVVRTALSPADQLEHNSWYRLSFPEQPPGEYLLRAEAEAGAGLGLWASGRESYGAGNLHDANAVMAGDLVLRGYYSTPPLALLNELWVAFAAALPLMVILPAILLLPGAVLRRWLLRRVELDLAAGLAMDLGLALVAWPLLLQLLTILGVKLDARVAIAVLLVCAAWLLRTSLPFRLSLKQPIAAWLMLALTAGSLLVSWYHGGSLALPLWVDAVHHSLIVRLIAEAGAVPVDYGSLLPAQPFLYHFGFHTVVAVAAQLGGLTAPQAVLVTGQAFTGLAGLSAYLLAWRLTERRSAALVAGMLVALVLSLPHYYVSWSRYPQLAGLIVLPAVYVVAVRLSRPGPPDWRAALLLALLGAGSVMVHPRMALLAALLVAVALAFRLWEEPDLRLSLLGRFGAAVGLALLLAAPWLWRLALSRQATELVTELAGPVRPALSGFIEAGFPTPVDKVVLLFASVALVGGLVTRRRWALALAGWLAVLLLIAAPSWFGLPFATVLSSHSLAIALFMPVAVAAGAGVGTLATLVRRRFEPRFLGPAGVAALLVVAMLGGQRLSGIVNPVTYLATDADARALAWVRDNTPGESRFLINSRYWQANAHTGTDAGYWLPVYGRWASLPPLPYAQADLISVAEINARAAALEEGGLNGAQLAELMRCGGLTHVFIGALGGPIDPSEMAGSPEFGLVHRDGGSSVWELRNP